MEDTAIIALYYDRDERAISETDTKYGNMCRSISYRILSSIEDSEECVNDTYHKAWNSMPPEKPRSLCAFLGAIVRNLSIDRYRKYHSQKRFSGIETMLSELDECVPSLAGKENVAEDVEISAVVNSWLGKLSYENRKLFMRRYFYGLTVKELARELTVPQSLVSQKLFRLRRSLREELEKEGIAI